MYKIVHLPSGNYVVNKNTGEVITYFNANELQEQVFENRRAIFRRVLNYKNCEEETEDIYCIDEVDSLKYETRENGVAPHYLFEMVEEVSFWNV